MVLKKPLLCAVIARGFGLDRCVHQLWLCHFPFHAAAAKSLQSCPTLSDPIDGSPPGSSVPGTLQARTLEWVAISFSNAWKWSQLSRVWLCATPWTAAHQAPPSLGFSRQEPCSGVPLPAPSPSMAIPQIPKWELPHYLTGYCITPGCLGPVQVCVAVGQRAAIPGVVLGGGLSGTCALCCREYLAVFKKTVSSHEVFLQRLSSHPVLSKDRNFHVFLEYDQDVSHFNCISTILIAVYKKIHIFWKVDFQSWISLFPFS